MADNQTLKENFNEFFVEQGVTEIFLVAITEDKKLISFQGGNPLAVKLAFRLALLRNPEMRQTFNELATGSPVENKRYAGDDPHLYVRTADDPVVAGLSYF